MNQTTACGPIPAPVASAAETEFISSLGIVGRDLITVQETGFAGVAFFGDDYRDTDQCSFVAQHFDKVRVRDLHKRLIVALAHLHLLLPEGIFPDDERANALCNQQSDDRFGSQMQLMLDAAIALVCDGV